jgi:hypothetical protein
VFCAAARVEGLETAAGIQAFSGVLCAACGCSAASREAAGAAGAVSVDEAALCADESALCVGVPGEACAGFAPLASPSSRFASNSLAGATWACLAAAGIDF